jgi:hypothetical protein
VAIVAFVPIIAFGRRFLVELPSRSSWQSQKTSESLPSDGVIFYLDGSLCEGRESYALGSLAMVFQTEDRGHAQHDDLYMF